MDFLGLGWCPERLFRFIHGYRRFWVNWRRVPVGFEADSANFYGSQGLRQKAYNSLFFFPASTRIAVASRRRTPRAHAAAV